VCSAVKKRKPQSSQRKGNRRVRREKETAEFAEKKETAEFAEKKETAEFAEKRSILPQSPERAVYTSEAVKPLARCIRNMHTLDAYTS